MSTGPATGRKTVLQVYGGSPKKKGSLEEYFLALSVELYREGYQCVFVFDRQIEPALLELYREAHAEIVVIPQSDRRFDPLLIARFCWLFSQLKPAAVNFHFGRSGPNGLLACRLLGLKATVWTKHSFYEQGPFYQNIPRWKTFASMIFLQARLARRVIAVSNGLKEELLNYHVPNEKLSRVYLGINLERFGGTTAGLPPELAAREGCQVFSCISQARPEKGLEHLLKALPLVLEKWPGAQLLLVGGGPLTDELRVLAEKLGVADNVTFCGVRNDVERIIAGSLFTVLPSLTEGLPLALLESQAAGKPVIASRVGGIPEVIFDGVNGFLVPPRDEHALADRIVRLLQAPELLERMTQVSAARARIFDLNCGVAQTMQIYREVMTSHV